MTKTEEDHWVDRATPILVNPKKTIAIQTTNLLTNEKSFWTVKLQWLGQILIEIWLSLTESWWDSFVSDWLRGRPKFPQQSNARLLATLNAIDSTIFSRTNCAAWAFRQRREIREYVESLNLCFRQKIKSLGQNLAGPVKDSYLCIILSQFCLTDCHVRQKEKKEVADFLLLQLFEHLSYLNQYSNPGFVKFHAKLSVITVQITWYNLFRWTALHTKTTSTNLCIKGWIVIVKTTVDVVFILTNEMHSLQHFVKLLIFRKNISS